VQGVGTVAAAETDGKIPPVLLEVAEQGDIGGRVEAPGLGGTRSRKAFCAETSDHTAGHKLVRGAAVLDVKTPDLPPEIGCVHAVRETVACHIEHAYAARYRPSHLRYDEVGRNGRSGGPEARAGFQVQHENSDTFRVCTVWVNCLIMYRVIAAAHDHHGLVGAADVQAVDADFCGNGCRPGLSELGIGPCPLELGGILVSYIERVVVVTTSTHAEDKVYEILIDGFDLTILVAVHDNRNYVAVESVILISNRLVEVQVAHVFQQLMWHERPKFCSRARVDGVQIAVVSSRIHYDVRFSADLSVND